MFNAHTADIGMSSNGVSRNIVHRERIPKSGRHVADSCFVSVWSWYYLQFPHYTVAPYRAFRGSWSTSGDYSYSQYTNRTIAYTWQASLASDIRQRIGFTVYHSSDTLGIFYTWYDYVSSKTTGDTALIGASGAGFSKPYNITYLQNTPGKIRAGVRLAFDTNCNGSITVG
ncbi:uncharacterized protein L199_002896 [Kwoniella botswanensis]|uniref:uncharacterized protein n=1 Tax=Kwoniella botswanensis TaxID=1268659 RepID=UPI00315C96E0